MGDPSKPGDSGKQPKKATIQDLSQQQYEHLRQQLRQIGRARTRLMVCLLTLPVYMVAVWFLLQNQRSVDTFMFMYMALWAAFAIDMARRRCPNCGQQFFVKVIFLNLISKRCVHCTLPLTLPPGEGDTRRQEF
jgi:hypothetical protein